MAEQRYKVIERIDAGGMAEVFKANSTSMQGFEKLVAIKRILPNLTQNERFVRMFLDEAKVSLHLNHTNCVHVFDLGIADGTYFIVMEFIDGTNLKKLIEFLHKHNQRMAVEQAVFIAIEVCKGLTHAHEKKDQEGHPLDIVHRDISPPNILLSKAGEVKITDFGLAKAKSQAESTDPGVVKGKFGYLSPEAAHGEEIDARTDIFAVGILLWEMLAGRRLFLGESDYETLQLVRKAQVPRIDEVRSDVPSELVNVLMRALTGDPNDRYQTAKDLADGLGHFLFDYGRVVTSYHIADLVEQFRQQRPKRRKTAHDEAVGAAIQKQLDRLKSLEEIEDLDMYLAQHYDSLPDQGEVAADSDGNFEDPRMWADLGFGEPGAEAAPVEALEAPDDSGESWSEAGLDDIARETSAMQAIDAETIRRQQAKRAGPPTLPGGVPAPGGQATATRQQAPAQQAPAQQAPSRQARSAQPTQPVQAGSDAQAQPADQQPKATKKKSKGSSGLGAIGVSLIVAIIVVALGIGAGFVLGVVPP